MAFQVRQEKFEGPLEVLLDLIEREKLSVTEVSLAKLTDEYLIYIKSLEAVDPVELGEFLVVAAQLILIKSRALLPSLPLNEEEEGSIEELEKRLAEYQRIRDLSREIKMLAGAGKYIFTRESFAGREPVFYPPPKLVPGMLKQAFTFFLASLPKLEKLAEEKIKKIISLEEKVSHIRSFLSDTLERVFSDLVKGAKEKVEVIVSFLAILELAKQKFVDLDQEKLFSDIKIKKL